MEHDLWLCPALITREKKSFPVLSYCFPCCAVLFCSWVVPQLWQELPALRPCWGEMVAPRQQRCPGCYYKPERSPVARGISHLLWIFSKNWWSKVCWPHCSPPFLQKPSRVLSYISIFHGTPVALQQMAMQHCPLPRWASSFFHRLHLTMKQQKKRGKKTPLGSWSVASSLLLWGSQQYEHIDSNNSGISKWRSPETAGPFWHGEHSPEGNLQS